jgi:A/G-specific adenine glycosylase
MAWRSNIHEKLLCWYARHARDLPWRHTTDPYSILVSEVMLQQTGVRRVAPKYSAFLKRFPTFESLASASRAQVIRMWSSLGYNRRAVNLHATAQFVVEEWAGKLPNDVSMLRLLPGVGPYTAAAIASFAFGADEPVLDTNIRRVLTRLMFGITPTNDKQLINTARELLPEGRASQWSQALMDIGSTVCRVSKPYCQDCPLRSDCSASPLLIAVLRSTVKPSVPYRGSHGRFIGSTRYYRGRIVEALRSVFPEGQIISLMDLDRKAKFEFSTEQLGWLLEVLRGLEQDGLVRVLENDGQVLVGLP